MARQPQPSRPQERKKTGKDSASQVLAFTLELAQKKFKREAESRNGQPYFK